ncbi:hypothetical protein SSX86_018776 [Deinandra increscens subsp. villosa]|uniref:Uncharacterized protein n=1 Tax=Deinandra increscens subsp. villosa TaxID=3103831 RepID=A0AAP0CRI3_9ASTR
MAPPHHQVHLSLPFDHRHRHRRCSKAQMRFFQILHIISAFPSADNNRLTHVDEICDEKHLNISLRPPTETDCCPAAAYGGAVGENCVVERNDRCGSESVVADGSELAVEEERATEVTEHSEISHVGDQSSGIDYNGELLVEEDEKPRDEGYLGLLIEAAQLILGVDSDSDSEPDGKPPSRQAEPRRSKSKFVDAPATERGGGGKRRQQCWTAAAEAEWYAEFEDTSPVVKSKRGRNQVLPFRYRDSVVEPLVRWTTSSCKSIAKRRSK